MKQFFYVNNTQSYGLFFLLHKLKFVFDYMQQL